MTTLDWSIIAGLMFLLGAMVVYSRTLNRSVTDFLAANRCAGRYLLTLADGMTAFGVASLVANFEKFYEAGFGAFWWAMMLAPIGTVLALSGFVAYRYRETRALTMAEFFERRYSRKFRIMSGSLCFVSGLFNYGIFPMITSNLIMVLFDFPDTFTLMGVAVSTQFCVMAIMLSVAVAFTLAGGIITIMITDFIQSQCLLLTIIGVALYMVFTFDWQTITEGLANAPPGRSRINPFDQEFLESFNLFFFAVFAFKVVYNVMGWQSNQGYFAAARSPHEFRMSRILAHWREAVFLLIYLIVPTSAFVFLHHAAFADQAETVRAGIEAIGDEQTRKQMTVPSVLVFLLPAGLLGLFAAAMIFAAISTDDTQLHSWASILVQDVIIPIRGRPLEHAAHIRLLRCAVVGVALFALLWSTFFPLRDYVLMYMLATGTIYLGGSGAVIIGGLYWKKATAAGAWGAMITGALIGLGGVLVQGFWPRLEFLHGGSAEFPLNGVQIAAISYLCSIIVYVALSLLTYKEPFNFEKLFHRGPYAIPEEGDTTPDGPRDGLALPAWKRRLGINRYFTRGDIFIYFLNISWTGFWFVIFLIGCAIGTTIGISDPTWLGFWRFMLTLSIAVGIATSIWFITGGTRDFFDLVRRLKTVKRDQSDDGWVDPEN